MVLQPILTLFTVGDFLFSCCCCSCCCYCCHVLYVSSFLTFRFFLNESKISCTLARASHALSTAFTYVYFNRYVSFHPSKPQPTTAVFLKSLEILVIHLLHSIVTTVQLQYHASKTLLYNILLRLLGHIFACLDVCIAALLFTSFQESTKNGSKHGHRG